jgi:hypothetical protein
MLKVFLKIPGVPRPHAVVGRLLFEDERYLVIVQDVIRRKILWENVLYVEEIPAVDTAPPPAPPSDGPDDDDQFRPVQLHPISPSPNPIQPQMPAKTSITVAFTGALNRLFTIDGVDRALIEQSRWTPDLAKLIFTNSEIKTVLGSFVVKDIVLDGSNITITTDSEKKDAAMADIQAKVNLVNQIATAATKFGAPRTGRLSMRLPTDFSMSSSPFERPVPLSEVNDNMEDDNVGHREEEAASEIRD